MKRINFKLSDWRSVRREEHEVIALNTVSNEEDYNEIMSFKTMQEARAWIDSAVAKRDQHEYKIFILALTPKPDDTNGDEK